MLTIDAYDRWCDDICLMVYSEGDSFHSPLSGRCLSCQFYLIGFMLYVFLTSYAFLTSRLILGGDTVSHWQGKYVIGLTGNIAVGKSVVRQMLQHLGAYTIDADSLAHQAMMPGAPAYKTVVSTFGQMIVGEDGRINRAALGNIVFGNPQALKKLEELTHPVVRQAINALIKRSKQRVVVIEAIKLLDGDLHEMVDTVWVVNADPKTQYKRLIEKRKMNEQQAKQRMLSQGKQADKIAKANVVVQNNGNVEETWKQVQAQWVTIKKQLGASKPEQPTQPTKQAQPAQKTAPATPDTPKPDAPPNVEGITSVRGNPGNADAIASFIKATTGEEVGKMDILMKFGEKSFLFSQNANEQMIALMGWTVENLVTRMDELYMSKEVPINTAVTAVVGAVEEASHDLNSEVAFIFLPESTDTNVISALKANGYESTSLPNIKVPAWREAVEEGLSGKNAQVLWKQLRQDRVLQPI
jgi:dephospho-CoA kinase